MSFPSQLQPQHFTFPIRFWPPFFLSLAEAGALWVALPPPPFLPLPLCRLPLFVVTGGEESPEEAIATSLLSPANILPEDRVPEAEGSTEAVEAKGVGTGDGERRGDILAAVVVVVFVVPPETESEPAADSHARRPAIRREQQHDPYDE